MFANPDTLRLSVKLRTNEQQFVFGPGTRTALIAPADDIKSIAIARAVRLSDGHALPVDKIWLLELAQDNILDRRPVSITLDGAAFTAALQRELQSADSDGSRLQAAVKSLPRNEKEDYRAWARRVRLTVQESLEGPNEALLRAFLNRERIVLTMEALRGASNKCAPDDVVHVQLDLDYTTQS